MSTMSLSHHSSDGSFRNPWPDSEPRNWRDVLRWERERRAQSFAPTPRRNSFPRAAPALVQPHGADSDFTATWIGHSTVLLQLGALNVLTDPVFSQRASPVQWAGPKRVMDPAMDLDALPP